MRFRPAALLYFAQRLFCAKAIRLLPHRDSYLLTSKDHARSFHGSLLHKWNLNACPMSSMDFAENGTTVLGAWETGGQVNWASLRGRARQAHGFRARGWNRPQASTHCQQPEGRSIVRLDRGDRLAERRVSGLPDGRQCTKT